MAQHELVDAASGLTSKNHGVAGVKAGAREVIIQVDRMVAGQAVEVILRPLPHVTLQS